MAEHIEGIKGADHKLMIKPLVMCLQDKKAGIRQLAEQIIVCVIGYTGVGPFNKEVKNLKPAQQQSVTALIKKAENQAVPQVVAPVPQLEETKSQPPPKPTVKPGIAAPTLKSGTNPIIQVAKSPEIQQQVPDVIMEQSPKVRATPQSPALPRA